MARLQVIYQWSGLEQGQDFLDDIAARLVPGQAVTRSSWGW